MVPDYMASDLYKEKFLSFFKLYLIVALGLLVSFVAYSKYEDNKIKWANEIVAKIRVEYAAEKQKYEEVIRGYQAELSKSGKAIQNTNNK